MLYVSVKYFSKIIPWFALFFVSLFTITVGTCCYGNLTFSFFFQIIFNKLFQVQGDYIILSFKPFNFQSEMGYYYNPGTAGINGSHLGKAGNLLITLRT